MKKVFCYDCEFEKSERCEHPNNKEDDSYAPKHSYKNHAEYINGNNDCKWYKKYKA